ncbi:MAG: hypothetical protein Q9164_007247 [Protoblastenia rupestris]
MHVRPARPSHFSSIADLSVSCFWDDELYDFTSPHKKQYPDDFCYFFLRRTHLRYWTPGFVYQVALTDEGDEGHEGDGRVVGYACWFRQGNGQNARQWHNDSVASVVERTLAHLRDIYVSLFNLDRSLSLENLHQWLSHTSESFDKIPELWKLQNLCVDPSFQRRGIGGLLMKWGKEQATKEKVPLGLTSSTMGSGLYLKQGFKRYSTLRVEGFPVGDVPVFLWEPTELEGTHKAQGDVNTTDAPIKEAIMLGETPQLLRI